MQLSVPRIAASSYSNTAPLVWSFLYGSLRGSAELIMDTAPARSAELLASGRVDAALVPVFSYQTIPNVKLIPDVCVGAKERVRSVCLVTNGMDLADVRSVALDESSRTSAALTKIIFREFYSQEPEWTSTPPSIDAMLAGADCALIIGDPSLRIDDAPSSNSTFRKFDLAELWRSFTGLGFVFAMWMTAKDTIPLDFAAARDEGVAHIDEIAANYTEQIGLGRDELIEYLGKNIAYSIDESMMRGLQLYFQLAEKNRLIEGNRPLIFVEERRSTELDRQGLKKVL